MINTAHGRLCADPTDARPRDVLAEQRLSAAQSGYPAPHTPKLMTSTGAARCVIWPTSGRRMGAAQQAGAEMSIATDASHADAPYGLGRPSSACKAGRPIGTNAAAERSVAGGVR